MTSDRQPLQREQLSLSVSYPTDETANGSRSEVGRKSKAEAQCYRVDCSLSRALAFLAA